MPKSTYGTLIVIQPDGTNIRVDLQASYLRIGRGESCDVVISDPKSISPAPRNDIVRGTGAFP